MASYTTAWVIGSGRGLDFDVTVNASAQSVVGDLYLYHPTAGLSLLGAVAAAMTAAGVAGASAVLTRDRRVKLSAGGTFAITWTDVGLRDLLKFTGNLAGSSSYTAPGVSPLLWSPAKPLKPELSPIGTAGIRRPLTYATISPADGSAFAVSHGSRQWQRFTCSHVAIDRVFPDDEAAGSWVAFFDESAGKLCSFYVYPEVVEDPGSSTTATLADGLGPYVLTPSGRAPSWSYSRSRGFEWCDRRADVDFACHVVPEYS